MNDGVEWVERELLINVALQEALSCEEGKKYNKRAEVSSGRLASAMMT